MPEEKNSFESFKRAFDAGHGLETDVRDYAGDLVIAHDPATASAQRMEALFELYSKSNHQLPLALNIKADGLSGRLKSLLQRHDIKNYFCFDMSVPETLNYRRAGLRFFTRESEYEPAPVLYSEAAGVWMDMFQSDWITPAAVAMHLEAGKQVALVSPELHKREHLPFWISLRDSPVAKNPQLFLCTDFPDAAREFFHD